MSLYKKSFANAEEAYQAQVQKNLPFIYVHNGEYIYFAMQADNDYYTGMVPFVIQDGDSFSRSTTYPDHCKIYRYIEVSNFSPTDPPLEHDYKSGTQKSMYPKRTFVQGELQLVEYYADKAFTDLIFKVQVNYVRDALGFATERTTTRTWYREDGSAHPTQKITNKVYDELAQIIEGEKRRGNIKKLVSIHALKYMIGTITDKTPEQIVVMGRDFLKVHQAAFNAFISESNTDIYADIAAAQDDWLDNIIDAQGTTIKAYVLNEINIWGL